MTSNISKAIEVLKAGGLVAYPTESFWALGADATDARAVKKVFRLKGRGKKPIALIAGSIAQVGRYFHVTAEEQILMKRYWPGALTVLLQPKRRIAARALAPTSPSPSSGRRGDFVRPRIGVRVPKHTIARKLAIAVGVPLTATSANISGKKPTKSLAVIQRRFPGIMVVFGSCGKARIPSTIVKVRRKRTYIIRKGSVTI
ncbi:MAG: L-threonylcarbamoyladenylate synthase [Candidatus Kerfeldbacteria bacterium]